MKPTKRTKHRSRTLRTLDAGQLGAVSGGNAAGPGVVASFTFGASAVAIGVGIGIAVGAGFLPI